MSEIYLDHAATTPLAPEVRAAMRPFLEGEFGNPSSRHPLGVRAAEAIERARGQVARAVCAAPRNVVFTSGGTEASNLAVLGIARAAKKLGQHVVVGPTEHACVRESALALEREGFEVEFARLASDGALDLDDFARRLKPSTVLVAQMLANNEFGGVYPIARLARLVRKLAPRARLVVDAVQAFGKLDCSLTELGADALILSAHKVHGPKGVGALIVAGDFAIAPLVHGGGQERGVRSGTENVAGLVGFGIAAETAEKLRPATVAQLARSRATVCERVRSIAGARVLEPGGVVLPSIAMAIVPGAPAEVVMHHLEARGVFVSAGSACQAAKKELSPALRALGLSVDEGRHVLRISLARTTSDDDVERGCAALIEVVRELAAVAR
jgi:cysteine desulfurase